MVLFLSRILNKAVCSIQYFISQIPTVSDGIKSNGTDGNWFAKLRDWGIHCNTDGLPNAVPTA